MSEKEPTTQPIELESQVTPYFIQAVGDFCLNLLGEESRPIHCQHTLLRLIENIGKKYQGGRGIAFVIDIDGVGNNDSLGAKFRIDSNVSFGNTLNHLAEHLPNAHILIVTSRWPEMSWDKVTNRRRAHWQIATINSISTKTNRAGIFPMLRENLQVLKVALKHNSHRETGGLRALVPLASKTIIEELFIRFREVFLPKPPEKDPDEFERTSPLALTKFFLRKLLLKLALDRNSVFLSPTYIDYAAVLIGNARHSCFIEDKDIGPQLTKAIKSLEGTGTKGRVHFFRIRR